MNLKKTNLVAAAATAATTAWYVSTVAMSTASAATFHRADGSRSPASEELNKLRGGEIEEESPASEEIGKQEIKYEEFFFLPDNLIEQIREIEGMWSKLNGDL